jgi:CheY-like chemotaxis protein/anti-sigma regulatory factor (Ser/Thr protein kinase)
LDLAKIEAGRMDLELTDFALVEMLTSLAELFRVRAENRGLAFVYAELTALPTWVRGDEKKLRQVLMNLLSNAVKFTETGTVALHVGYHADKLRFQVEDTGVGIATTHLQDIFEAFHQLNAPNRMTEGTGLGLAISRTLTTLMGGVLQVASQVGQGTRFWFELDLPAVEQPERIAHAEQRTVIGFTGDPVKILVVEDKWENRSVLANMLAPLGFEVVEAVDGHDGVQQAMALQPAVIFMDLKMPIMDGIEAIRHIRELPFGHDVVIIAISASAFEYNRQDSLEAGSDDFLAKPFRLHTLLDLLKKHVHLEWIYAPETESPTAMQDQEHVDAASPNTSVSPALHVPPQEEIGVFLDCARRGNIAAIRERVHTLEQRDARYTPFAAQVRQLAQGFKINAMEAFFARLLQANDPGEQK